MTGKRMSGLLLVLLALAVQPGHALAEAYCKRLTGYGQGTDIVTAADGARGELRRLAYAQFGARPIRHNRIEGMINRRFACHESRRGGQIVHHCRVSGTFCRAQGLRRVETDPLMPRRF